MSILKNIYTQQLLGNALGVFNLSLLNSSLVTFQKNNSLKLDGIAGIKTWHEILSKREIKAQPGTQSFPPVYTTFNHLEDKDDTIELSYRLPSIEEQKVCENVNQLISLIEGSKITRKITELYLHCTATNPNASVSAIENYWYKNLGWKNPGYHLIFKYDGSFTYLQDFNLVSNGVAGRNSTALNISYIGGIDSDNKPKDTRSDDQKFMLELSLKLFTKKLPHIKVRGHNEVFNKACPSFKVSTEYPDYV